MIQDLSYLEHFSHSVCDSGPYSGFAGHSDSHSESFLFWARGAARCLLQSLCLFEPGQNVCNGIYVIATARRKAIRPRPVQDEGSEEGHYHRSCVAVAR